MKAKQVLLSLILSTFLLPLAAFGEAQDMCLSLINYTGNSLTLQVKEGEGVLTSKDYTPRNFAESMYAGSHPFYYLGMRMREDGKLEVEAEGRVHQKFDFYKAPYQDEDILIVLEVFFTDEPDDPKQDLPIIYDEGVESSNSTLNYDSHCPGFSLTPHEHVLKVSPSYELINRTHHIVVTVIDGGRCPSAMEKVGNFIGWLSSE